MILLIRGLYVNGCFSFKSKKCDLDRRLPGLVGKCPLFRSLLISMERRARPTRSFRILRMDAPLSNVLVMLGRWRISRTAKAKRTLVDRLIELQRSTLGNRMLMLYRILRIERSTKYQVFRSELGCLVFRKWWGMFAICSRIGGNHDVDLPTMRESSPRLSECPLIQLGTNEAVRA